MKPLLIRLTIAASLPWLWGPDLAKPAPAGDRRMSGRAAASLQAAQPSAEVFALVKEGRPASCIVLSRNAGVVEKHAAGELSAYLGKISSGMPVKVVNEPSPELYNIRLGTLSDQAIAARVAVADAAELTDEGFILSAGNDGLVILGKKPVGVLYGVYELLQKYAGIRWLTPGEDGEYYAPKPTIAVPAQSTVHNPSLRWRKIYFTVCNVNSHLADTWDWMVRNKMQPTKNPIRPTPVSDDFLDQRGAGGFGLCSFSAALGGRCAGRTAKETNDFLAGMLREHPERCPLVQGTIKVDSPAWKNFRFRFSKESAGSILALAFLHKSGEISLDDVFMFSADAARTRNDVIPADPWKSDDAGKARE